MSLEALAVAALRIFEEAVLAYFLTTNLFYAVLLVSAVWQLRRHLLRHRLERRSRLLGSSMAPRISVLAPAFDEEATVRESVLSLLALDYPDLEVVVVNDGSNDATLEVLIEHFELVPVRTAVRRRIESRPIRTLYRSRIYGNLVVVDKVNGGKADALNAAVNVASADLVCSIDADTLIERDAMVRMVRPFLERPDLLAAGGTIRIANGCRVEAGRVVEARVPRHPLAGMQVLEYLRAFLFGRLGWNGLGGNLVISGAFGLFRREALVAAGGYLHGSVGEDVELVARMRRRAREEGRPDGVAFIPDPIAWTEVPETLRVLGRQRDRWHRGLADMLWRHRRTVLNPSYGALGLVVVPYLLFVELLAPVVEALGLIGLAVGIGLGALDVRWAVLFFLVAYGLEILLTVATILLDDVGPGSYRSGSDVARLVVLAMLEPLGYRQLTVYWRLRGLWGWLRGRTEWGAMERRGLGMGGPSVSRIP